MKPMYEIYNKCDERPACHGCPVHIVCGNDILDNIENRAELIEKLETALKCIKEGSGFTQRKFVAQLKHEDFVIWAETFSGHVEASEALKNKKEQFDYKYTGDIKEINMDVK